MRAHRTHAVIPPWNTGTPVRDPAQLAAIRVEPVSRGRRPALVIDLYFAGEDGDTVVPLVLADPSVVVDRDRDPLIFPDGTPFDDAFARAVAAQVLPHLERLVVGTEPVAEGVVRFADVPRFDAARTVGCFGAAPLRDALARLAPYHFARRFTAGRLVRIAAPDAAGGWALLRESSGAVGVDAAFREPAAERWYGTPPPPDARPDVAILGPGIDPASAGCVLRLDGEGPVRIDVVDPVPLDVGFSFDRAEGPACRWFAVERVPESTVTPWAVPASIAAGGSAGRIGIVVGRGDVAPHPAADTDLARTLAGALVLEGFDVVVADGPEQLGLVDLVHVIGARDGRRARAIVEAGRRARTPVAIHAIDDDAVHGGWWGAAVTRFCFEYGSDAGDVERYLALLGRRAVAIGTTRADAPFAPEDAGADGAAAALRDADVVFAATDDQAERLRARLGRRGPIAIVPPLAVLDAPAGTVAPLAGTAPFALVHAPIGPAANQLVIAHAAAAARIPLVLAGPVADAAYLERVREFGGTRLIVLAGEPAPGFAAALRAAATVVIDAAWLGDGPARLAAALLAGARVVVSDRHDLDLPGAPVHRCDPGDAAAVARALGEAWDEALRSPRRSVPNVATALDPSAAVRAIVRGYALVAGAAT